MTDLISNPLFRQGMRLNHLRLAVAIAEEGQIGRAATRLCLSQPATSRMLADLERLLGCDFCERGPHGVALTPVGRAFVARAQTILLEAEGIRREIEAVSRGEMGAAYIGSVAGPSVTLVTPLLQQLKATLPRLETTIHVSTSDVLVRELLAGSLDFTIARIPKDLDLALFSTEPLKVEQVALIARCDHPLTHHPVGLADLVDAEWIMEPAGSLMRRAIEETFVAHGLPLPRSSLMTNSLMVILATLSRSDAIAPVAMEVADLIVESSGPVAGIKQLALTTCIEVEPYSLIRVAERNLSSTAAYLYAALRDSQRSKAAPPPLSQR